MENPSKSLFAVFAVIYAKFYKDLIL